MSNLVEEYLKSKQIVDKKTTEDESLKSDKVTDPDAIQKLESQDSQLISRKILFRKFLTKTKTSLSVIMLNI